MGDEIKTYDPSGISQKLQWVRTASKEIIQNDDVENKILGVFEKYLKEAQKKGLGLDILDSAIQRILYYMFLDSNVAHNKKDIDEAIKGIQDRGTSSFLGTIRKQTKFIESSLAAINKLQQTVPKTIEEFKANPQYQEKIGYKGEDPAEIEKYIVKTDIWDKIRMDIQKARDSGQVSYDIKQSLNTPEFQFPVSLILQEISNPSIIPVEVQGIKAQQEEKKKVRKARAAEEEAKLKARQEEAKKKAEERKQAGVQIPQDIAGKIKDIEDKVKEINKLLFDKEDISDKQSSIITGSENLDDPSLIPFITQVEVMDKYSDEFTKYSTKAIKIGGDEGKLKLKELQEIQDSINILGTYSDPGYVKTLLNKFEHIKQKIETREEQIKSTREIEQKSPAEGAKLDQQYGQILKILDDSFDAFKQWREDKKGEKSKTGIAQTGSIRKILDYLLNDSIGFFNPISGKLQNKLSKSLPASYKYVGYPKGMMILDVLKRLTEDLSNGQDKKKDKFISDNNAAIKSLVDNFNKATGAQ